MKKLLKNEQGFTIIEVMIVLVIAAVIMLIVFLAVPALQRNSRNTNEFGQLTTMNLSTTATAPTSNTTTAGVWINATCSADGSTATTGGNPRGAVVLYTLEPATTRCVSV
jgi:prepilin-type N-terminal cleavage/methylation domain-containing protein